MPLGTTSPALPPSLSSRYARSANILYKSRSPLTFLPFASADWNLYVLRKSSEYASYSPTFLFHCIFIPVLVLSRFSITFFASCVGRDLKPSWNSSKNSCESGFHFSQGGFPIT